MAPRRCNRLLAMVTRHSLSPWGRRQWRMGCRPWGSGPRGCATVLTIPPTAALRAWRRGSRSARTRRSSMRAPRRASQRPPLGWPLPFSWACRVAFRACGVPSSGPSMASRVARATTSSSTAAVSIALSARSTGNLRIEVWILCWDGNITVSGCMQIRYRWEFPSNRTCRDNAPLSCFASVQPGCFWSLNTRSPSRERAFE